MTKDYPVRTYEIYTTTNTFFPLFESFFGLSFDFYAGYIGFPYFTPGYIVNGAILYSWGIPINFYHKISLFGAIYCYFLLPIIITKKLHLSPYTNIFTIFYQLNSVGWIEFIRTGVPHDLIGMNISMMLTILLVGIFDNYLKNNKIKIIHIIFTLYLFQQLILTYIFVVFLPIIISSYYYFIHLKELHRKNTNEKDKHYIFRNMLKRNTLIILLLIFVMGISILFWLNSLFYNIEYTSISIDYVSNYEVYSSFWLRYYYLLGLQNTPLYLIPIICVGLYYIIKRSNNTFFKGLALSFIAIHFILFILSIAFPSIIMNFARNIFILDYFTAHIIFFGVENLQIKLNINRIKVPVRKFAYLYIILIGIFGFVNRVSLFQDFQEVDPEVSDIFNWINYNTSNRSRIMLEDTIFTENQTWGIGRSIALAPIYTERTFIGGFYSPTYFFRFNEITSFYAGNAFNAKINELDLLEFLENLKKFNIEFIIVWNSDTIDFLDENNLYFLKIVEFSKFKIYQYLDSINSYCFDENFVPFGNEMINFKPNNISMIIHDVEIGEKIFFSFLDQKYWKIKINSTNVDKNPEDPLFSCVSPIEGDISIEISWKNQEFDGIFSKFYVVIFFGFPILGIYAKIKAHLRVNNI